MDWKKMILELKALLATVTFDAAKKAEIEGKIAAMEAEAAKAPATPAPTTAKKDNTTVELPAEVTSALSEISTLKQMMLEEKTAREKAEKAMADRLKLDAQKRLDDYIKKVTETENKISPADMKEKWQPLLESNFEATSRIIDAMPAHPATTKKGGVIKTTDDKNGDAPKAGTREEYIANEANLTEQAKAAFSTN